MSRKAAGRKKAGLQPNNNIILGLAYQPAVGEASRGSSGQVGILGALAGVADGAQITSYDVFTFFYRTVSRGNGHQYYAMCEAWPVVR